MVHRIIYSKTEVEEAKDILDSLGLGSGKIDGHIEAYASSLKKGGIMKGRSPVPEDYLSRITYIDMHREPKPTPEISEKIDKAFINNFLREGREGDETQEFCEKGQQLYKDLLSRLKEPVVYEPTGERIDS